MKNYTHMKLEDIENAINQNQFWDMWNNFNTNKPQALPIQNVTSGEHILTVCRKTYQ